MTLTIGRFGLSLRSGEVQTVSDDGRKLQIAGVTVYASAQDAVALRQQLTGYVNSTDEPFIPVTWPEHPEIDGYYTVQSVSMREIVGVRSGSLWDFSVDLERVTGFATPLIEVTSTGAVRSNTHGFTAGVQAFSVPNDARSVGFFYLDSGSWIPFSPDVVRDTVTGGVKTYRRGHDRIDCLFYVEPESFYQGAATIMMGDELAPVVGRQTPDTAQWRISNGLLEIEPGGEDGFSLQMRMWLPDGWSPWVPFQVVGGTTSDREPLVAPHSVTVMRNSPLAVTVRLLGTSTGQYSPMTFDITLRRGERLAVVELESVFISYFGVRCSAFTSPTVEDEYRWKTIGDARMVMAFREAANQTGADVRPDEDSVPTVEEWSFGIGLVPDDGGTHDNVLAAVQEYFWAGSQSQSVVLQ